MSTKKHILTIIVFSQFCCTSLWFAGNGVINELITNFNLESDVLGPLTSTVQFGFIIGTLLFAILTITDRFSPSSVFLASAFLGAFANLCIIWQGNTLTSLLILRFLTGFFLAGIYPVGMKIAADYFEQGLGKSLGLLVGALVIGTAFPHLMKGMMGTVSWELVLVTVSAIALFGGLLMFILVPDGPHRKPATRMNFSAFFQVFENVNFRTAAFGYFGHMWELYAFWAFIPLILKFYTEIHSGVSLNIPVWSFIIIGTGSLGCFLSGKLSQTIGPRNLAFTALLLSCVCCLVFPIVFKINSVIILITFLLFWGFVVIADSPMFSTLVAQNASGESKGTAITIVTCLGFAVTIGSIQLLNFLWEYYHSNNIFLILAIGPLFGLMALNTKLRPL